MKKEIGFWVAVGLAGVVTSALLKVAVARAPVPTGLKEVIAAS